MANVNYTVPGVYKENADIAVVPGTTSNAVGGMQGIAQRGKVGQIVTIDSWNAYVKTFAGGMETPFLRNSYLAYAVYGFFQNDGRFINIQRVAGEGAMVASTPAPDEGSENVPYIFAKDEGAWGNDLTLTTTANADVPGTFNVSIRLKGAVVETFFALNNTENSAKYWVDFITTNSTFVEAISGTLTVISSLAFTGGSDGADVVEADYEKHLPMFDRVIDLTYFAVPGVTTTAMYSILKEYSANKQNFVLFVDAPQTADYEAIKGVRSQFDDDHAVMPSTWINITDPLSRTYRLMPCPTSGHAMGVYARINEERGPWKAPAGTEANIRGAVSLVTEYDGEQFGNLNTLGIMLIDNHPNNGILIWGARVMKFDTQFPFVSSTVLDVIIKRNVDALSRPYVFEPNKPSTWVKMVTDVEGYMHTLYDAGGLAGDSPEEAYYVRCDWSTNTPESVRQGICYGEVGYARDEPMEFIIYRFSYLLSQTTQA